AEVARHNKQHDGYIIIDGVVYDVTNFLDHHPGGPNILMEHIGKDATVKFEDIGHSLLARYQLADLYVGEL
ncbi:hypothetical protein GUITHDRAFT_41116, partial [Guillardia theta CCMP2712]